MHGYNVLIKNSGIYPKLDYLVAGHSRICDTKLWSNLDSKIVGFKTMQSDFLLKPYAREDLIMQ